MARYLSISHVFEKIYANANKYFMFYKYRDNFFDFAFYYFVMKVLLYTIKMSKQNYSESQTAEIAGNDSFFTGFALKVLPACQNSKNIISGLKFTGFDRLVLKRAITLNL